jgi:hypothetical protein
MEAALAHLSLMIDTDPPGGMGRTAYLAGLTGPT